MGSFSKVVKSFTGGIHPKDSKHYTENMPIIDLLEPQGLLVYPMSQHIGAPCKPTVKKGDLVLRGQCIGEAGGFVSAAIHTAVSGKVVDVKPMLHPNGQKVMSVIIENDHEYNCIEGLEVGHDYTKMTKEEIIAVIRDAGIVGMGGAGFPAHVKLSPAPDKKIDAIIINGAECEPFLTSDYRIMIEDPDRVVEGLKILLSIFPEAKGYIGVENNKPKAQKALQDSIEKNRIQNIEVVNLLTKYPQGGEKMLIKAVLDREVPSGGLPADVGAIVHNIDTIVAIYRAIVQGRPLMRRIVTVAGSAIKNPGNFKVRIGTPLRELVEAAGGFVEEPKKMIHGGPMMGMSLLSLDAPVVKGTSALLFFNEKDSQVAEESPCIRCGKCINACPMGLLPYDLNQFALRRDWDGFVAHGGMDCIECGSCAFACPAKRQLTQTCKAGKTTVNAMRKKK